ncbi:MAG TPA: PEP-CTERM sorting domain-containing protein [Phycisphaerae bacterium]|nr:PEP-CTERM sorting domain-containing protein [Phycisphaerae bacterium]
MKTILSTATVCLLVLALLVSPTNAQNYQVGEFDEYKYLPDGSLIPDVDKPDRNGDGNWPDAGDFSCWQAAASNLLAAGGYGIGAGAGATAQQRADHIYGMLNAQFGWGNMGQAERAINWWLYQHGKNPGSPEYDPGNSYTDVTVVDKSGVNGLTLANPAVGKSDYNFLLDELNRCQYVAVGFQQIEHCITLVGGNYWLDPNLNASIWHDSDRDFPDTVTHPVPIGASVDDDVYPNQQGLNNTWQLAGYPGAGAPVTATKYVTFCPGLNKPQEAVENYDVAYFLQDTDHDGAIDDPDFRVAGRMAGVYGNPQWDGNSVFIPNEYMPEMWKEVYLLVDYTDRVADRDEDVLLQVSGEATTRQPTSVDASDDDGQLLFYWDLSDLPYQPDSEMIIFPDCRYRTLTGDVKDWDVATICVPEPATLAMLAIGAAAILHRRRRRTA